jgi:hypothetical protein
MNDVKFKAPIDRFGDRIQFDLNAETFMSSRKPIAPLKTSTSYQEIPDISPLDPIVSIPKIETEYTRTSAYPIKVTNSFSHPHTILLHYSKFDVKNEFEETVTDDQFESRAIIKGFTAATARAQSLYGVRNLTTRKRIFFLID